MVFRERGEVQINRAIGEFAMFVRIQFDEAVVLRLEGFFQGSFGHPRDDFFKSFVKRLYRAIFVFLFLWVTSGLLRT